MPSSQAIYAYSRARSASFVLEFLLLDSLSLFVPKKGAQFQPRALKEKIEAFKLVREDLFALLKADSDQIEAGTYPLSVMYPESPIQHFSRFPKLIVDAFSIYRRRLAGKTTEFDATAREILSELPRYYRRNFHFQTNGYLSRRSAEVYDHQVELLFKGGADAMRRLILAPMRAHFGASDGEGLKFLEIGAGTGRATRFVRQTFPKAKIIATDLSEPYLKVAQKNLSDFRKIDFIQADGAHLPLKNQEFDAVYSVFLFHELPMTARKEILAESRRILKPGGFFGLVDSIQTGDKQLYDKILETFPKEFHEPYYRDYIAHPMEELLREEGFKDVNSGVGFTSKVCYSTS